jgi:hypothetical protein
MNGGTLVKKKADSFFESASCKGGVRRPACSRQEALSCLFLQIAYEFLKSFTVLDEFTLLLTHLNMNLLASFSFLTHNIAHKNPFFFRLFLKNDNIESKGCQEKN